MSNNKSSVESLENELYKWLGGRIYLPPIFFEQAKKMEIAGKEMSYAEGYAEGYKRALELIEWILKTELKRNNVHESVNEQK
jgi:hypothetical protein